MYTGVRNIQKGVDVCQSTFFSRSGVLSTNHDVKRRMLRLCATINSERLVLTQHSCTLFLLIRIRYANKNRKEKEKRQTPWGHHPNIQKPRLWLVNSSLWRVCLARSSNSFNVCIRRIPGRVVAFAAFFWSFLIDHKNNLFLQHRQGCGASYTPISTRNTLKHVLERLPGAIRETTRSLPESTCRQEEVLRSDQEEENYTRCTSSECKSLHRLNFYLLLTVL